MPAGRLRVEWSAAAAADVEEIVDRIAEDRPEAAREVFLRLRSLGDALSRFPERGRVVPELRAAGLAAFREVLSPSWRLVYRVMDGVVGIVLVFDARRNTQEVLVDRLIRGR
jgi:plasmid stabilization system protein ParE